MSSVVAMLGLPQEAAPVVLACAAVIFALVAWATQGPQMPPAPRPRGVFKDGILWRATSVGKFVSVPDEGITHVWACLERTVKRFPSRNAVGQRPLLKREFDEDPKNPKHKYEKLSFGDYEWMTYVDYYKRCCSFATGMVQFAKLKPKDRVVIYGETHRDWFVAALACFRQDLTVVTIYATLGEEGVVHGINQTKAATVVADTKLLPVLAGAASQCKGLKHVVTLSPNVDEEHKAQLQKLGIEVKSMEACALDGAQAPIHPADVTADDIAVIMYTSGTTGLPKGVLISHGNFMAGVAGVQETLSTFIKDSDVYLAYLPLAHIMEMMVETSLMYWGLSIGYGSPHTLTNTGVKLQKGQTGDAVALRPTLMVFAPAVLDKVYAAINDKVGKTKGFAKTLFALALEAGLRNYDHGGIGAGFFWNTLVFRKIQALLGGRVRGMITGSAPLAADVQKFVQTVFNSPVRQGYGLTETCAASCLTFLGDNAVSTVGPPVAAACIKLRDWPEGGYMVSDRDKPEVGMPRGEVLIGGPVVTQGYLVDEETPDEDVVHKNKTEYVTLNGIRFFCSGDIGQVTKDGNLQIIDRKKDLVKLQQGEYVALSKVENVLKSSTYVDQAMVYAQSTHNYCVALICPRLNALQELAEAKGVTGNTDTLCSNTEIVKEVSRSCLIACKTAKLAGFEIPKKVGLVADPWTPENDMLTAAMKMKRKQIVARHKEELDKLYA